MIVPLFEAPVDSLATVETETQAVALIWCSSINKIAICQLFYSFFLKLKCLLSFEASNRSPGPFF